MLGPYNKGLVALALAIIMLAVLYWGNEGTQERILEAVLAILMPILVYLVPNIPSQK